RSPPAPPPKPPSTSSTGIASACWRLSPTAMSKESSRSERSFSFCTREWNCTSRNAPARGRPGSCPKTASIIARDHLRFSCERPNGGGFPKNYRAARPALRRAVLFRRQDDQDLLPPRLPRKTETGEHFDF